MTTTATNEESTAASERILQRRLDAGLAIAGGARGSLTKALHHPGTAALLQLEMTKLALIIQRNERMIQQQEQQANALIQEQPTTSSLPELRTGLETAQALHACWQRYEGQAAAIVQKHVISEAQLNADIADIDVRYTSAKEQLAKVRETAQIRASQCQLLQRCIQDLQQSVEEDRTIGTKDAEMDHATTEPETETPAEDTVMKDASDDDEEEGELYGDLDSHL